MRRVGEVIAWIGEAGEEPPPRSRERRSNGRGGNHLPSGRTPPRREGGRINASPVARRLAGELGVDLAT